MNALKQRPPRYRRLSRVTKPRSSAPTRGSCAAVAMAARKQHGKQIPSAIAGGVALRAAAAPSRSRRCVPTAHQRRYVGPARQPKERLDAESTVIPNGSRGEFAHPATPSNRRRCIRSTASTARGQSTDRRARDCGWKKICTPTLRKKIHLKTGSRASPAPRPSSWTAPSGPTRARCA